MTGSSLSPAGLRRSGDQVLLVVRTRSVGDGRRIEPPLTSHVGGRGLRIRQTRNGVAYACVDLPASNRQRPDTFLFRVLGGFAIRGVRGDVAWLALQCGRAAEERANMYGHSSVHVQTIIALESASSHAMATFIEFIHSQHAHTHNTTPDRAEGQSIDSRAAPP